MQEDITQRLIYEHMYISKFYHCRYWASHLSQPQFCHLRFKNDALKLTKNQYGPVSFSAGNTTDYLPKALKINYSLLQHALQIIWGQRCDFSLLTLMLVNANLCAWYIVRPNKLKSQNLEQRKFYCRAIQGDMWFMPS